MALPSYFIIKLASTSSYASFKYNFPFQIKGGRGKFAKNLQKPLLGKIK
jgi:hypothetical protein